jgi:hypothetical protein
VVQGSDIWSGYLRSSPPSWNWIVPVLAPAIPSATGPQEKQGPLSPDSHLPTPHKFYIWALAVVSAVLVHLGAIAPLDDQHLPDQQDQTQIVT